MDTMTVCYFKYCNASYHISKLHSFLTYKKKCIHSAFIDWI